MSISRDVLAEFRKLTGDDVVWERGKRLWPRRAARCWAAAGLARIFQSTPHRNAAREDGWCKNLSPDLKLDDWWTWNLNPVRLPIPPRPLGLVASLQQPAAASPLIGLLGGPYGARTLVTVPPPGAPAKYITVRTPEAPCEGLQQMLLTVGDLSLPLGGRYCRFSRLLPAWRWLCRRLRAPDGHRIVILREPWPSSFETSSKGTPPIASREANVCRVSWIRKS
jgi:hypothetical protein